MTPKLNSRKACAVSVTRQGNELIKEIKRFFSSNEIDLFTTRRLAEGDIELSPIDSVESFFGEAFEAYDTIIAVMAAGIAVRAAAPHLGHKSEDPGLLALDLNGRHVVSLLSGHLGNANENAEAVARAVGGEPVITTASERVGVESVDMLARRINCRVDSFEEAKTVTGLAVEGAPIAVWFSNQLEPRDGDGFLFSPPYQFLGSIPSSPDGAGDGFKGAVVVSDSLEEIPDMGVPTVTLRPKTISVGVGCRKGVPGEVIIGQIEKCLKKEGVSASSVGALASIDLKGDEPGIREASEHFGANLRFYPPEALERVMGRFGESEFVKETVGVGAVCGPCGCLASEGGAEVGGALKENGVTVSLWRGGFRPRGKVSIVGIGPGGFDLLTPKALEALQSADRIIGYASYINLIRDLPQLKGKALMEYTMGQEVRRVKDALKAAACGADVALVCSGDPGVYGMASLAIEVLGNSGEAVDLEVVPGVTASLSAAALLGAPLSNDFCTISLSDLLTPWSVIEKRIRAAAEGDFALAIYNPKGKRFSGNLGKAVKILLGYRSADTPVGVVRSASREGQSVQIASLKELPEMDVGMDTIVVVGNSQTEVAEALGLMYTKRGYEL